MHASVNYVGRTSLVVGIRVESENVRTGERKHTNTSYFTMVAKDDLGEPTPVPELILETEEDVRRCLETIKRRQLREDFKDEFDNAKSRMRLKENMHLLEKERVILDLLQ
jgi:acyl-CoA hydrolase